MLIFSLSHTSAFSTSKGTVTTDKTGARMHMTYQLLQRMGNISHRQGSFALVQYVPLTTHGISLSVCVI